MLGTDYDHRTAARAAGVIASMTLLFVLAIRELGSSLFLYTSNTMVMSVLLLDYYEGGNIGKTAASVSCRPVLLGVLIAAPTGWRGARRRAASRNGSDETLKLKREDRMMVARFAKTSS